MIKKYIYTTLAFTPIVSLAQTSSIGDVYELILNIIEATIPILIAFAVLMFLWNMLKYVRAGGDTNQMAEARSMILWSIVAIFVMVSVWGLVNILVNTADLDNTAVPDLPCIPGASC